MKNFRTKFIGSIFTIMIITVTYITLLNDGISKNWIPIIFLVGVKIGFIIYTIGLLKENKKRAEENRRRKS